MRSWFQLARLLLWFRFRNHLQLWFFSLILFVQGKQFFIEIFTLLPLMAESYSTYQLPQLQLWFANLTRDMRPCCWLIIVIKLFSQSQSVLQTTLPVTLRYYKIDWANGASMEFTKNWEWLIITITTWCSLMERPNRIHILLYISFLLNSKASKGKQTKFIGQFCKQNQLIFLESNV